MRNNFENIIFTDEVSQSEVFGNQYKAYLKVNDSTTFSSNLLVNDISDILNSILLKYSNLTEFQKNTLYEIFRAFNVIRTKIDPKRLKAFEHSFNEDDELLLYRKSDEGLTNIIIHSDECVAYSFIGKGKDNRILKFYQGENKDFEALSYNFFSH